MTKVPVKEKKGKSKINSGKQKAKRLQENRAKRRQKEQKTELTDKYARHRGGRPEPPPSTTS